MVSRPGPVPEIYRQSGESGESRAHSRNGYKSDGSHPSQESPLHLKPVCHPGGGKRRLQSVYTHHPHPSVNNHPQSYSASASASHLNAQYMHQAQPPPLQHHPHQHQRLALHPNKHLEASRSFHTFQRQESTTSFHSTHSAPSNHQGTNHNLMVNNIESASQASTHSHSSSSSASVGPPDYHSLIHPPPSYDQALIKLDIAMRRRAQTKRVQQQQKGAYNSLHYVGEFYG